MNSLIRAALISILLSIGACASTDVSRYAAEKPVLDLVRYFSGTVDAWGMFQTRSGEVVKRFHVVIEGREDAGALVLDEHFEYSDGSRQQRVWTLRRQTDGTWQGTAADVVGVAAGAVAGNTLHWNYVLRLPVDGRTYDVAFDDWMMLIDEHTLANRARMSKFGVHLGDVTLFMRRRG
ncbi:MAG: DUF3833 domain-containing protein [Pseudomonadota bacterium]